MSKGIKTKATVKDVKALDKSAVAAAERTSMTSTIFIENDRAPRIRLWSPLE